MRRTFRLLLNERGSAESALVLIPLLILFLLGMQLSIAIHTRNMGKMSVQDGASQRAISGEFIEGDRFVHINSSGDDQSLDLLVTRRRITLQDLLGGALGVGNSQRTIEVGGVAIVENRR